MNAPWVLVGIDAPWVLVGLDAPWVLAACVASITLYVRGWRVLRVKSAALRGRFGVFRLIAFLSGWAALLAALASPLDAAAERALSAHMIQHLLLAMIAPPLLLLAQPAMPLLFGAPRAFRRGIAGPILAAPTVRASLRLLSHPLTGLIAMSITTLAWHIPASYEAALRDPVIHRLEHASMLGAGLLFWLPVVEPFPFRRRVSRLMMVPYLVAADLANTVVAAALAFGSGVMYPWYEAISAASGVDALRDQQLAAGIMWIPGSAIFLFPAVVIAASLVTSKGAFGAFGVVAKPRSLALPVLVNSKTAARTTSHESDLLRVPFLGAFLRSSRARLSLRLVLLALALLIALDGVLGPQDAPMNLAGTLPWTHWRGGAIIAILALGNIACMACPLIAPRSLLRRWIRPTRSWPVQLRTKYLAVAMLVLWLVLYEAFDFWASPLATVGVFAAFLIAATLVDLLFEGASFCKYVCPIGQYQMIASTMSLREVRARDLDVCARCTTHDCLKSCGTGLFMAKKQGNLECTACLDCVSACPHDNIGVLTVTPAIDLASASWRSGLGTLATRVDVGVLALVFTVGALVNAAAMTEPVVTIISAWSRENSLAPWCAQGLAVVLAVSAAAALSICAAAATRGASFAQRFTRLALAGIPLGTSVWLMHFGFHFVTGWSTAEAASARVLHDLALSAHEPDRIMSCCLAAPSWLIPAELLALSCGLAATLGVWWWSVARMTASNASITARWSAGAVLFILCWMTAAWIVFQPMEMRGTAGFGP